MQGRQGIRRGQRVRDLDGNDLGRVAKRYDGAFLVVKGFPVLFRQESVLRDDEVRGERDGELVVARSDRSLFDLAAGDVPDAWRIPTPPNFPAVATPAEARGVFEELAAERAQARRERAATAAATGSETLAPAEEREAATRRGEPVAEAPSVHS